MSCNELYEGELAGAIDRDVEVEVEVEFAFGGTNLGDINVK